MIIDLAIPESISQALQQTMPDLNQAALEGVALQGYRQGILSLAQVRELLNLPTSWEAQESLASHGAWPGYTEADLTNELTPLFSA